METGISTENWSHTTIDAVLAKLSSGKKIEQGWSPQCESTPSVGDDTWGVLKTTAIQAGQYAGVANKQLPSHMTARPNLEVKAGDLLMTCAGPRARCGVPALVQSTRPKLMISGKMYRFRANEEVILPKYLEYFLLSPRSQKTIDLMKTGINDSGLNLTHARFASLPISFPGLGEQRLIVDLLEDQLSRLDASDRQVDTATVRLRNLRLSWLSQAIEGPALPLEKLIREAKTGWDRPASTNTLRGEGFPYLRMQNITDEGTIDLTRAMDVTGDAEEARRYSLRAGDVVLNNRNSRQLVGKTAFVDDGVDGWSYNNNVVRLRFIDDVDPKFMALQMMSPEFRGAVRTRVNATTSVAALYTRDLKQMTVRLPPIHLQREIVVNYERLNIGRLSIMQSCVYSEIRSAALRRALLAAAFNGRLTGRTDDQISERTIEAAADPSDVSAQL